MKRIPKESQTDGNESPVSEGGLEQQTGTSKVTAHLETTLKVEVARGGRSVLVSMTRSGH